MSRKAIVLAIALMAGFFTTAAQASEADRIAALEKEVASLREASENRYLENRRAEEVKSMVSEVLEDAESRQSLAAEGATAGWKKNFYLMSADGKFKMKIKGRIQFRWIMNIRDEDFDSGSGNESEHFKSGFEIRRAKVGFSGHIYGKEWGYDLTIAASSDNIELDTAAITYSPAAIEGLSISMGFGATDDLIVDNIVSSGKQLAVERSWLHDQFDTESNVGIMVSYEADFFQVRGQVANNESDWEDHTLYEILVRADFKVMGDWGVWGDFSSWSGDEASLFIGVGGLIQFGHYDYDQEANSASTDRDDWTQGIWTVDLRFEYNGFSATVALMGSHAAVSSEPNDDSEEDYTNFGILVQISYNINDTIEPFIRVEHMILDNQIESDLDMDDITIVTVGFNYFIHKHNLKITVDVVWAFEALPNDGAWDFQASEGAGLIDDESSQADGQVAVRVQIQLQF